MALFSITLTGTREVAAEITRQVERVPVLVGSAMYAEAQDIMHASSALVPVDTGQLAGTAMIESPRYEALNVEVVMGYGGTAAPYARVTHENPRAGKTGGVSPSGAKYQHWAKVGQWKYLEQPFLAAAKGLAERVASRVRAMQGVGRVAR